MGKVIGSWARRGALWKQFERERREWQLGRGPYPRELERQLSPPTPKHILLPGSGSDYDLDGAHLEAQQEEMEREQKRMYSNFQEETDSGASLRLTVLSLGPESSGFPQGSTIRVADVCFGAGPGGGDYRRYELEKNDANDSWTLWWSTSDEWTPAYQEWVEQLEEFYDSEGEGDEPAAPRLFSLQARGETKPDADPREVAYKMLSACWAIEPKKWDTDLDLMTVDEGGILSKRELLMIRDDIIRDA